MSDEKMNQSETIDMDTLLYVIKGSNNDGDTYSCSFFLKWYVRGLLTTSFSLCGEIFLKMIECWLLAIGQR